MSPQTTAKKTTLEVYEERPGHWIWIARAIIAGKAQQLQGSRSGFLTALAAGEDWIMQQMEEAAAT